jgi:hypothetical protein
MYLYKYEFRSASRVERGHETEESDSRPRLTVNRGKYAGILRFAHI